MPEGHSVHRIARQFARHFVGKQTAVSSPQGRFAEGATLLDGHTMIDACAVGKQMFLEFDNHLWLRVHLGLYGAWDFAGDFTADASLTSARGRPGQTAERGTILDQDAAEDSLSSIGAPRRRRLRMSEQEELRDTEFSFPAAPVGAVRVRLLTRDTVADLRGPTACEVQTPEQVDASVAKLGPDPLVDDQTLGEERFVTIIRKKPTPIGLLLMDQSVVSGIGNVYRAELLFRARVNPYAPGKTLSEDTVRGLWRDWAHLLGIGVETGQMMTMDDLDADAWRSAMKNRADRHWVYKREGVPCRVCGTHITLAEMGARKLYFCPHCQA
ncbi:MAG: Fpg/Nei family DNA glycosylase [Ramlibacter sp.]|nr:Fpg/Nei family DNA glycosylase [Cryobacterium sp.]